MTSPLCIIPEPKRSVYREGSFVLSSDTVIRVFPSSSSVEAALAENLPHHAVHRIPAAAGRRFRPFQAVLLEPSRRSGRGETVIPTVIAPEGYILDCTPDRILLLAGDEAGLFYACQTLFQLLQTQGGKGIVPAVRIEDAPDLGVRGAQIEPSFLTPTLEAVEARLRCFARYKLNTVLIGYVDKFQFETHPRAAGPDAYAKNDIRKLDALARSLHINLVPILQCLGHSENLLKHPEYAHLREGPEIHTQFCPENPDSFRVFKDMAEELMAVHASPYFHIGADEAYFLGRCPRCRKITDKEGPVGLFLKYVNRVCDFVVGKGKIPVLWDDMFCRSPARIKKLHPRAVVCYWDYFPADADNPFVFFRNEGYFCDQAFWKTKKWWGGDFAHSGRCHDLSELDAERRRCYDRYFSPSGDFRYLRPYPFHQFYQDAGHPTIGCATVRGGEYSYLCPDYTRRLSNIRSMIRTVARNAGPGVITTTWSEIGSPDELTLYPLVAAAEFCWSGDQIQLETFDRKFVREFFGTDDPRLIRAIRSIGTREIPLMYNLDQRADVCSKGGVNPVGVTYPALFDRRIADTLASPDLPNLKAELNAIRADVESALAFLRPNRRSVRRNRPVYDHLILAARTLIHKIDLFFFVCAMERGPQPITRMKDRCRTLLADMRQLKSDHEHLFAKTYRQTGIRKRSAMMFEGEMAKMKDYLSRLQSTRRK